MSRRDLLRAAGTAAVAVASTFPIGWVAGEEKRKPRVLMMTRSQGFEHSVVKRKGSELSLAEKIVTGLAAKHDFEVTCTKDGREFIPENLAKYDGFLFQTTGDLTKEGGDKQPPMPAEAKKAFLDAIGGGKGFIGCHCASDTFHSAGPRNQNQGGEKIDPYIAMLGGEFIVHGDQQKAWMRVAAHDFPGMKDVKDFELKEEWYALKNFAPNLHVLLVQDTAGSKGDMYHRPNFPATWARTHDNGRVFYTSMGHREDVWENPLFQQILLGAVSWTVGGAKADVTPNLKEVAPNASELKS